MIYWSASNIAFSVGQFHIYWYGVIYAAAILASWLVATYALRRLRDNGIPVPSKEEFDGFMFWAIVTIVVGARLGHVLFFEFEHYIKYPSEIFMLRNGGLSFHGAVIALGIYIYRFVKKSGISWWLLSDVMCLAGALGVGIGRLANFMNQELYGKVTSAKCSVVFSMVDHMPRYPTQLFESFFEGLLNFWILLIVFRLRGTSILGSGKLTMVFCTVYSSARFVIEFYKEVEMYNYFNVVFLSVGQALSIGLFLFGILALKRCRD
ncbi:MAG: prolipoprotein diacylglyceryl transferase [Holosporales bacterium]|jgi:phosphatidylglycerol:prolipoprotein diacylglycerol transferase|nr:prolipoprotein diacylglyceryl transferase [Holosporales bacterium]